MQSNAAVAMTPTANNFRSYTVGSLDQRRPAMRQTPSEGRYKARSDKMIAVGKIQLDTGSIVTKKKRIPNATTGDFLRTPKAMPIARIVSASPVHATQS